MAQAAALSPSACEGRQKAITFIGIDPYMVMIHRAEKATLYRRAPGHETAEEISCYDPLEFIEAELGQYHLVSPSDRAQDELPKFHGGAVGYLA